MKFKYFIIILISIVLVIFILFMFKNYNLKKNHADVKIPVLLYHDFLATIPDTDPDNFNYINTPQSFEENIKILLENGYTFISMQELYDANSGKISLPEKPILITLDDGYYSNYEYTYPILKKYNVKASIYVVTNKVGTEENGKKYLSWDNCLEMQNSGLVEIYSHSKRHLFYDRFPARVVRDDVSESYKIIEQKLGKKNLKVFVYPYGAYTKDAVRALKLIGIDMQIYDIGMNQFKNFNKDYIKRLNIPCEMTGKEIIEEIEK